MAGGRSSGRSSRSSAGTIANNSSSDAAPIASSIACWSVGGVGDVGHGVAAVEESAEVGGRLSTVRYAEFVVVNENFAYKIPDVFTDAQAAPLLCGGVIGYRALRVSGLQPGERIGLYGFGSSAHIALQIARHWQCEAYVFTRSEEHRALARQLGAAWTGGADDTPPRLIDRAIIFAPVGDLVLDTLRVMRKGGTVAHAGVYSTPIPQMDYNLLYHERVIRSVANSTRQDAEDLCASPPKSPCEPKSKFFRCVKQTACCSC